jgi:aspartyl-tRNA(Asn)/glutamyl-tRNA(Gln) amidotransferase subunit A
MNIEDAYACLRARQISAVELLQQSLASVREQQPLLNAFITITEDLAFEQARRADKELASGVDRGPLHGIPYSLKDVFATKGIRTTCGSRIFAEHIPDHDAAVFEKLSEAGAVLVGKNGMHELAYGVTSDNPYFGTIRNPRNTNCIPGGSSGGSAAAVASEQVFFSIGTDTGGSIRVPAAYCGCVGLKPTSGRVSRYGIVPIDFSLDHAGPITRTARDAALVMNAIAGFDRRDDTSSRRPVPNYLPESDASLGGRRLGIPENFFNDRVSPTVAGAFDSVLENAEKLGAKLVPLTVPAPAEINVLGRLILLVEASAAMEPYLARRADFGADVLRLLDQGQLISGADYVNAQRLRRLYQKRWAAVWEHADLILTPTIEIEAPEIGLTSLNGEDIRSISTRFARPFNVLGLPAISVPVFSSGLPVGFQLAGKAFEDPEVISVGALLSRF